MVARVEPFRGDLEFELLAEIAVGATARIELCRITNGERKKQLVVVKRLLPHIVDDPQFLDMFRDEVWMTAALEHSHIVQVVDWGRDEYGPYLAVEFVRGVSLARLMKTVFETREAFTERMVTYVAYCICDGLVQAHALCSDDGEHLGLVHRDLTPGNVLLGFDGEVKIADFGMAKAKQRLTKTLTGMLKGPPEYMAPEQIRGEPLDGRCDVFALGVMLFELFSGQRPWKAANDLDVMRATLEQSPADLLEYRPEIDKALVRVVNKCLEKEPKKRFVAKELRDRLHDWLRAHGYLDDNTDSLARFVRRNAMRQMGWFDRAVAGQFAEEAREGRPEPLPTDSSEEEEAAEETPESGESSEVAEDSDPGQSGPVEQPDSNESLPAEAKAEADDEQSDNGPDEEDEIDWGEDGPTLIKKDQHARDALRRVARDRKVSKKRGPSTRPPRPARQRATARAATPAPVSGQGAAKAPVATPPPVSSQGAKAPRVDTPAPGASQPVAEHKATAGEPTASESDAAEPAANREKNGAGEVVDELTTVPRENPRLREKVGKYKAALAEHGRSGALVADHTTADTGVSEADTVKQRAKAAAASAALSAEVQVSRPGVIAPPDPEAPPIPAPTAEQVARPSAGSPERGAAAKDDVGRDELPTLDKSDGQSEYAIEARRLGEEAHRLALAARQAVGRATAAAEQAKAAAEAAVLAAEAMVLASEGQQTEAAGRLRQARQIDELRAYSLPHGGPPLSSPQGLALPSSPNGEPVMSALAAHNGSGPTPGNALGQSGAVHYGAISPSFEGADADSSGPSVLSGPMSEPPPALAPNSAARPQSVQPSGGAPMVTAVGTRGPIARALRSKEGITLMIVVGIGLVLGVLFWALFRLKG